MIAGKLSIIYAPYIGLLISIVLWSARNASAQLINSTSPTKSEVSSAVAPGCKHGVKGNAGCPDCESGWTGPFCDACLTDGVCKSKLGFHDARCSKLPVYTKESVFKSYACSLDGNVLGTVLQSFALSCNTTYITDSNGRSGGMCQVGLTTKSAPDNSGVCTVTACVTQNGSSKVQCKDADCHCLQGTCPDDIAAYQGLIQGKDIELDCTISGNCTIDIQDFPIQVKLPCVLGDCQSASNTALLSGNFTDRVAFGSTSVAIVASLPLVFLVSVIGVYILCYVATNMYRRARENQKGNNLMSESAMMHGHPRDNSQPFTMRFKDLSCKAKVFVMNQSSNSAVPEPSAEVPLQTLSRVQPQTSMGLEHSSSDVALLKRWSTAKDDLADILEDQSPDHDFKEADTQQEAGKVDQDSASSMAPRRHLWSAVRTSIWSAFQRRSEIQILNLLNGAFHAKELVGVLGPSGSGKTTLLSILAGSTSGLSPGAKVNGQKQVNAVLQELGVWHIKDRQIGGFSGIRGISGGEMRRVSIGTELVTDASILILDEPTSGLDSATASSLLATCKEIVRGGRLVVASLHQPSAHMFSLLDHCLLMAQGQIVFQGVPNAASEFFSLAGIPHLPGKDIAEHMLEAAKSPFLVQTLAEFNKDRNRQVSEENDIRCAHEATPGGSVSQGTRKKAFKAGMAVILGALCGVVFRNLSNDIAGAQGRLGAVFFTLCLAALTTLTSVDLISHERMLVVKEVQLGYYTTPIYYLTKVTIDGLLLRAMPTALYCVPLYTLAKLNPGIQQVAVFFCVSATFAVTVGALSMAVATGVRRAGKSAVIINIIFLLQLLLAGYFKDVSSITQVLRWMHWLSPFFYAFQTLVVNEVRGLVFKFSAGQGAGATLTGDAFLDSVHLEKNRNLLYVGLLGIMYAAFVMLGMMLLAFSLPKKRYFAAHKD